MKGEIISLTNNQLSFLEFLNHKIPYDSEDRLRYEKCKSSLVTQKGDVRNGDAEAMKYHHSPQNMVKFLSLFSRDDDFKWYTHKWDQVGQSLENMISNQVASKRRLSEMAYDNAYPVNQNTYMHVLNFINFKPKPNVFWQDNQGKKINVGWHSITDLHKHNPDILIENLKLSDGYLFGDYIRHFKSSIEFRTDLKMDDRFHKFVRNTMSSFINGAVELDFTSDLNKIGKDLSIYCDIPALRLGLQIICDWIVRHKQDGNKVTVDLHSTDLNYELEITHHHSYFSNIKKLESPSGDFDKLRKRLFSVCDFIMQGDLKKDGEARGSIVVGGLDASTEQSEGGLSPCTIAYSEDKIDGVKYKFILYK